MTIEPVNATARKVSVGPGRADGWGPKGSPSGYLLVKKKRKSVSVVEGGSVLSAKKEGKTD